MAEIFIISMKIRGEWKPCLMSQFLVWFFCFHDIFSPHPKIFQCHIKTRTFLISLSLITLFRYTQSKVFFFIINNSFWGGGGAFFRFLIELYKKRQNNFSLSILRFLRWPVLLLYLALSVIFKFVGKKNAADFSLLCQYFSFWSCFHNESTSAGFCIVFFLSS